MDYNTNPEAYLTEALEFYDSKSILYKKWYTVLVTLDIITSALIPFITLFFDKFHAARYIVALMGSFITIISTFKATFRFHEKWIDYRSTAETLKYHKYLFETESSPYKGEGKVELLISNIHLIVDKENKNWRSVELNNKRKPFENQ